MKKNALPLCIKVLLLISKEGYYQREYMVLPFSDGSYYSMYCTHSLMEFVKR